MKQFSIVASVLGVTVAAPLGPVLQTGDVGRVESPVAGEKSTSPEVSVDNSAALEYLQVAYGLTSEQAQHRLDREASAEAEVDRLADIAGEDWAGAWIDQANGGTVHLLAASPAATRRVGQALQEKWMVVELTQRSLADLRELRAQLGRHIRAAMSREAQGLDPADDTLRGLATQGWRANLDVATNSLEVQVPENSPRVKELVHEFAALSNSDSGEMPAMRVETVEALELSATPDDCPTQSGGCIPLRGGVDLQLADLTPWCTTGFTFARAALTSRWTSSADHCNPSPTWKHADQVIGPLAWGRTAPSVDAMMIQIENNDLWKASNIVWRPNNHDYRITSKISAPDNSLQGITVCHVGRGLPSNNFHPEQCGALTSIDGQNAPSWASPTWDGLGVASYKQCSGDSGGPVFNGNTGRAYGLVRGRTGAGSAQCSVGGQGGVEAMFSWVSNIEAASGFRVLLTP